MTKVYSGKFTIKQNDTLPIIEYTCARKEGSVDLTGATVAFRMKDSSDVVVATAGTAALGASPTLGEVQYSWAAADTATDGEYSAEFEITHAGGEIETFPKSGFITVTISPDIA